MKESFVGVSETTNEQLVGLTQSRAMSGSYREALPDFGYGLVLPRDSYDISLQGEFEDILEHVTAFWAPKGISSLDRRVGGVAIASAQEPGIIKCYDILPIPGGWDVEVNMRLLTIPNINCTA